MKICKTVSIIFLFALLSFLPIQNSYSGSTNGFVFFNETDNTQFPLGNSEGLMYFFDLRDRETFVQLTFPDVLEFGFNATAHVQIFDVSNNCNENNFFDVYTINDTHVYNMRDIQTNDGNPSGVVLPEGSYGIVAISLSVLPNTSGLAGAFGNMRIIDNNGYEYRTNAQSAGLIVFTPAGSPSNPFFRYSFNYNSAAGVTISDIVGINLLQVLGQNVTLEWDAQDVVNIYTAFDIDIVNDNEVLFSCRNVIFSCVDEDNPRLEELLETAEVGSVASFEYGINEAIPHSKGGELLCPGNTIPDGIVNLSVETYPIEVIDANSDRGAIFPFPSFYGYVGLNNGNGRGSFDSFWVTNFFAPINDGN